MSSSSRYQAPFGPTGSAPVDAELARRLLSAALAQGGDYADLFFEYNAAGSYALEEGILKSAGRSISMGLGVRVMKGDATGYAYVQELTPEAMLRAAKTAAQIASGSASAAPASFEVPSTSQRYAVQTLSLDLTGEEKRELLQRADSAARAADPRVVRVEASLHEELREILLATSSGKLAHDRQPMVRFSVRVIAEEKGKRQSGSSGGGGRMSLDYFSGRSPEWHAAEAVRHAVAMLDARESPAGELQAIAAFCSTKRWATASKPTSIAKAPATTPAASASASPAISAVWWTTRRSPDRAARSASTTRATCPRRRC
jgi:TldD protein